MEKIINKLTSIIYVIIFPILYLIGLIFYVIEVGKGKESLNLSVFKEIYVTIIDVIQEFWNE